MLPIIVCEKSTEIREQWMALLSELLRNAFSDIRAEVTPCSIKDLNRILSELNQIMMVILGTEGSSEESTNRFLQAADSVNRKNRDNYLLLSLKGNDDIHAVLNHYMRPSGIVVSPAKDEYIQTILQNVLEDYSKLNLNDADDYFVVTSGKGTYRVLLKELLYIEAQGKMLNIYTLHCMLTVRKTLDAFEQTLPETFIRCHRSYIVNKSFISDVNLSDMLLTINQQESVPVSRGYKDSIRQLIKGEKTV